MVAMLRPIAPFVEYAINYDYISKVLCINKDKPTLQCNGKCQLMQKIQQQQDDDFRSLRIVAEDYPIGFVELLSLKDKKQKKHINQTHFFYKQTYSYLFVSATFHPPNTFHL